VHRRYTALMSAVHGHQEADSWTLITISGVWSHVSTVFGHTSSSRALRRNWLPPICHIYSRRSALGSGGWSPCAIAMP